MHACGLAGQSLSPCIDVPLRLEVLAHNTQPTGRCDVVKFDRLYIPPPPHLYKLRPCPSYSRRRDCINLGPNFNSVPNVVQPHKTWVW